MKISLIVLMVLSARCWSQTGTTGDAQTKGPCSPAVTGSHNQFTINCQNMSQKQGEELLAILNRIAKKQLDPELVLRKIDEMAQDLKYVREQQSFSGLLSPGNEPTPDNPCNGLRSVLDDSGAPVLAETSTLLLLGNAASFANSFPQVVMQIGDDDVLIVDKIDGQIAISAKLWSSDRKIVADLDKNHFHLNPNNVFRKEKPDDHSLVVYDDQDVEILNVRFINPTTISFLGIIRNPLTDVEISKTRGFFANSNCSGNSRLFSSFKFINPNKSPR